MFLKRIIILAAGVLLCIVAFVIYFEVTSAQMEDRFRAERETFHLDHLVLTASTPAGPTPASASPTTPGGTNTLIGPVPPPVGAPPYPTPPVPAAAPDATPAPTPNPGTDSNAAPAPAPSTLNYPREGFSSFRTAGYAPHSLAPFLSAVVLGAVETTPAPSTTPPAAPVPETATTPPAAGESSVIVLLYHQFVPAGVHLSPKLQWTLNQDVFESQMKYIHDNGYHVVPLSDVIKFIKHQITLPPGSVCITIDDGFKSAIVYAAPILKKYGYPWTYYIYPAFITVAEGKGAASWNDLIELQKEGIDIECHSMTHPQLTHKGNKTPEQYADWLKNETAGAKAILEQHLGKPVTSFAYPFGAYNKQVEAAVVDAGFESILTVADNPVHSTTSLHSIGRYTITQNVVKNFPAYLRQSALSLTRADPEPGATISNPRPVITAVLSNLDSDTLDPASLETSVRDFGTVRHDFDPQTKTVRMYLPRDLITPVVLVNVRVRDAKSGQVMVANWHFNYEPGAGAAPHAPISPAPAAANSAANTGTNAAPESMEKSAAGTPLDAHEPATARTPPASPRTD